MSLVLSRAGRIFGASMLVLLLSSAARLDASAQLQGTPVAADPGTLAISVFSCVDGVADPEIVDVAPACPEGGTASLWIDGVGPNDLQDGGTLGLDPGDHTVSTSEAGS